MKWKITCASSCYTNVHIGRGEVFYPQRLGLEEQSCRNVSK